MRVAARPIIILASLAGITAQTGAQTCLGSASFASGIARIAAAGAFSGGSNQYAGIGTTNAMSPNLDVVPHASVQYVHALGTENYVGLGSNTQTRAYGTVTAGVGFVMKKILNVHPSVSVPFGLAGGKTVLSIGLAINFGHRSD